MNFFTRPTIFFILILCLCRICYGTEATNPFFTSVELKKKSNKNLSLELKEANLSDTIRLLAKFLHMNVIVSPNVTGFATLQLNNTPSIPAFDALLASHGLARWRLGNIWFVATKDELIKRKQEEIKWQEVTTDTEPLVTTIWQIKYAKAEEIARLLQDDHASLLSKRGRVRLDTRTNSLCIQDILTRIEEIRRLIKRLDVPVKQIVIESRLASVDSDFERELGLDFAVKPSSAELKDVTSSKSLREEIGHYSLAVAKLADGSLLDVKLSALEKAGHAELISSPRLFTANQQLASIEAGEEVPYQEVSESGGTAVVFKKAVLSLRVIPQVLPGNKVLMQLQINQDRPSNKMVLGVPTISTRQITTNVLVRNDETIVLGGIYESNRESGQQRLPFFSQIPLLGWLFKLQTLRENKRELLIFVTPKIIIQET